MDVFYAKQIFVLPEVKFILWQLLLHAWAELGLGVWRKPSTGKWAPGFTELTAEYRTETFTTYAKRWTPSQTYTMPFKGKKGGRRQQIPWPMLWWEHQWKPLIVVTPWDVRREWVLTSQTCPLYWRKRIPGRCNSTYKGSVVGKIQVPCSCFLMWH